MSLYEVYVDGASRGQGSKNSDGTREKLGHGAAAVLIYKNKKLIGQYARGLGKVSNNVAEYEAVLLGLIMCWSADLERPIVYCDSETIVNQILGKSNCKSENLLPLLRSVKEIELVYPFTIVQVPRKDVSEADALADAFLNQMLEPPMKKSKTAKRKDLQTPKRAT
ncbi:MAG: ribonuclease HI family protein [Actinobacteria bacterium]|nr:ribonuclease HI family protein [Actinomycetota bacterium]